MRTPLPANLSSQLFRYRVRPGFKGIRGLQQERFDAFGEILNRILADDGKELPFDDDRWFGDIADALGWEFIASWPMKKSSRAHITRHEAGAGRCALRSAIFSAHGEPMRVILGIDSDPVVYAFAKGRSPSRRMNGMQRRLGMEMLIAGFYVGVLRIPSLQNPGDAPSRRQRVRRKPVPSGGVGWAKRFVGGDADALATAPQLAGKRPADKWLSQLPPPCSAG